MNKPILELKDISYSYHNLKGETPALSHISFQVERGEFIAIAGPSGCGKSTLLSIIFGLLVPESGEVLFHISQGEMQASRHQTAGLCPKMGYMLQHDHLFEWRTIYQNVLLGLEINHQLTEEKKDRAIQLLKDYDLYKFKDKKPSELSGGMKQRAALIRTLVLDPEILLLDEPFSALDYQTRLSVSSDICNIIRSTGKTAILITHDLSEAISLSDRILVMSKRPATIKCDIPIHLTISEDSPLASRNAPEYRGYFNQLWKEISDENYIQNAASLK
ncbi:NitT/TauT family transport system ATP-binding protein [Kineothrix alysoides]|uniref:NitT/TauT family transport system ATP-binding protein n=1 Tax=Kineothrix alysoides TaxID=1469948 RepID=A0A4R1QZK7_9FIRM|nr:ABC transporter ATP-binding protein [Kineothrix alysoides]TCL58432.1 NitT/TauT family transport system ATP-binding protein [Kineothrix alysoides]